MKVVMLYRKAIYKKKTKSVLQYLTKINKFLITCLESTVQCQLSKLKI